MSAPLPINLMLVEDERVVAFDLKNQLQSYGYRVGGVFASGEQALARVSDVAPDLVLMDINLEGNMDGVEAAKEIQARHQVPVIYLTAYAEDDTLHRALESRPFGYLVKPWNVRELHATIQMALARREVELAVEESERRFKLAVDAASLGIVEWSPAGRLHGDGHLGFLFGNRPTPVDEPTEQFLERLDPRDRDQVMAALARTRDNGDPVRVNFRTLHGNGDSRFLEARLKAHGGLRADSRVVGILQDITERRQAEERLRQSSVVFQTAAEAIVVTAPDWRITAVNAAFSRITGYREAEALGRGIDALLQVTRQDETCLARLARGEDEFWQGEVRCRPRSGQPFPAWQSLSVVRNGGGEITNYVVAFSDVSSLHEARERLDHLAHHDPLTGLPNRMLFYDRLDQAIEQAGRHQHHCQLLFIDLDSFKVVNDTLGHALGDELLRVVAGRLKGAMRGADTIARFGGDEFVVLAGNSHTNYATSVARKILETLRAPVNLAGDQITVQASIGIAVFPDHGRDRHTLMRAADLAMYSAKAHGRNRYEFYHEGMSEASSERLVFEQGLRRALAAGGLEVHYQPQISLQDHRVVGVEALVRWAHPGLGVVPPSRFIPVAEESGVVENLGRWVLQRACQDIQGLVDSYGNQLPLAVNVSVRQFMRAGFAAAVHETVTATGFPAAALKLEITESTLQSIERSREIIAALKAFGFAVSLDDFGTGYSSLSVLRDLPIDQIKIDRSFITEIPANPQQVAMVEAVVALSRSLRMSVLVEGIEREEQAAALFKLGCEHAQGYLYSQALRADELRSFLDTDRERRLQPLLLTGTEPE